MGLEVRTAELLLWNSQSGVDVYDLGWAAVRATTRVPKRGWKNPSLGFLPQNALDRARGESYTASDRRQLGKKRLPRATGLPSDLSGSDSISRFSANTDPRRHLAGEKISVMLWRLSDASPLIKGSFHDVSTVRHAVPRLDVRSRSAESLAGRMSEIGYDHRSRLMCSVISKQEVRTVSRGQYAQLM